MRFVVFIRKIEEFNVLLNLENMIYRLVNGLGAPNVLPPFALGLGTQLTASPYGGGIPSLGAFALATTAGLGTANPAALRGFSNVLLVSNLNEEVFTNFIFCFKHCRYFITFCKIIITRNNHHQTFIIFLIEFSF